ncbi:MAG TPA: head-tail connector protein [Chitinophagaceae bacterium]|nr:head-tail connector protein [Chitinophagaceae bacterium]
MNEIWELKVTDGSEPVNLATAKEWLRVTSSDDDDLITSLITVARKKIERFTTRSLVTKTIVLTGRIEKMFKLPYAPVNTISQVRVLDGQTIGTGVNEWETLDADEWQAVGYYDKHFKPFYGGVYEITYTTLADSDGGLLTDLKRVLLWLYENRGDDSDAMPMELMSNAKQLKDYSWE